MFIIKWVKFISNIICNSIFFKVIISLLRSYSYSITKYNNVFCLENWIVGKGWMQKTGKQGNIQVLTKKNKKFYK